MLCGPSFSVLHYFVWFEFDLMFCFILLYLIVYSTLNRYIGYPRYYLHRPVCAALLYARALAGDARSCELNSATSTESAACYRRALTAMSEANADSSLMQLVLDQAMACMIRIGITRYHRDIVLTLCFVLLTSSAGFFSLLRKAILIAP